MAAPPPRVAMLATNRPRTGRRSKRPSGSTTARMYSSAVPGPAPPASQWRAAAASASPTGRPRAPTDHKVPVPETHHARHRLVELPGPHRAPERSVEGEDAAVRGDEPVAHSVAVGHQRLDRGVEPVAAHGAVETGVAEGEDAAVA